MHGPQTNQAWLGAVAAASAVVAVACGAWTYLLVSLYDFLGLLEPIGAAIETRTPETSPPRSRTPWVGFYKSPYRRIFLHRRQFSRQSNGGCSPPQATHVGRVELEHGKIRLDTTIGISWADPSGSYFWIRWKQDAYLVPEDEMIEFCNFVNGSETDCVFASNRNSMRRNLDSPTVPSSYAHFILNEPVHASVVGIDTSPTDSFLTLDAGQEAGLQPGLRLAFCSDPYSTVVVKSVAEGECTGVYEPLIEGRELPESPCLTTRLGVHSCSRESLDR